MIEISIHTPILQHLKFQISHTPIMRRSRDWFDNRWPLWANLIHKMGGGVPGSLLLYARCISLRKIHWHWQHFPTLSVRRRQWEEGVARPVRCIDTARHVMPAAHDCDPSPCPDPAPTRPGQPNSVRDAWPRRWRQQARDVRGTEGTTRPEKWQGFNKLKEGQWRGLLRARGNYGRCSLVRWVRRKPVCMCVVVGNGRTAPIR